VSSEFRYFFLTFAPSIYIGWSEFQADRLGKIWSLGQNIQDFSFNRTTEEDQQEIQNAYHN